MPLFQAQQPIALGTGDIDNVYACSHPGTGYALINRYFSSKKSENIVFLTGFGVINRWYMEISPNEHPKSTQFTHGNAVTREAAMAAFAKSWRRE
jgi:hypothetical protein